MNKVGNPNISEAGKKYRIKPIGIDTKLGDKVFGFRLPPEYEKKLNSLNQKDRVIFIRSTIMEALDGEV
jgi:hypothetical protein